MRVSPISSGARRPAKLGGLQRDVRRRNRFPPRPLGAGDMASASLRASREGGAGGRAAIRSDGSETEKDVEEDGLKPRPPARGVSRLAPGLPGPREHRPRASPPEGGTRVPGSEPGLGVRSRDVM